MSQLPLEIQDKIQVLFDGVEPRFFHPSQHEGPLSLHGSEQQAPLLIEPEPRLLSYGTRGMESLRGFAEFMRMLPPLLATYPGLMVVIFGADRLVYSYPAPSHEGSWKQHLLAELGDFAGSKRVHFTATDSLVPEAHALMVDLDNQAEMIQTALQWFAGAKQRRQVPRTSLLDPTLELKPCLKRWQQLIGSART